MPLGANQTLRTTDFENASSGAADKIIVTGADGQIDKTFVQKHVRFGGDGSDGALAIASGTTTINLGGVAIVTKNYTSVSITGTGKLAFSNPHANGSTVIIKSQGNVTLTSSQTPMIDLAGIGADNGNDGYSQSLLKTNLGGTSGVYSAGGVGGAVASLSPGTFLKSVYTGKYPSVVPGAGGGSGGTAPGGGGGSFINPGSGGGTSANSTHTTGGTALRGGGGLVIECGGALNFTTASGISVAGQAGGAGIGGNGSGAGGGGGGVCVILYNTLTASSGTITVSGGAGGAAGGSGGAGGAGGAGHSLVAKNTEFA